MSDPKMIKGSRSGGIPDGQGQNRILLCSIYWLTISMRVKFYLQQTTVSMWTKEFRLWELRPYLRRIAEGASWFVPREPQGRSSCSPCVWWIRNRIQNLREMNCVAGDLQVPYPICSRTQAAIVNSLLESCNHWCCVTMQLGQRVSCRPGIFKSGDSTSECYC